MTDQIKYEPSSALMSIPEIDRFRWASIIESGRIWMINSASLFRIQQAIFTTMPYIGADLLDDDVASLLRGHTVVK